MPSHRYALVMSWIVILMSVGIDRVWAVPASPGLLPLTAEDGSVVWGYMFGDEHLSWFEDDKTATRLSMIASRVFGRMPNKLRMVVCNPPLFRSA